VAPPSGGRTIRAVLRTVLDQLGGFAGPLLLVAGEVDTTVDPDVLRHTAGPAARPTGR
jgi:hypothetical protein